MSKDRLKINRSGVLETANPGGEAEEQWSWVEREVWTDRMLTALEEGVKGGVWYSLIDKVWSLSVLNKAFTKVKRNDGAAGIDFVTIAHYESRLESELRELHESLKSDMYKPNKLRRQWIPKADKPGEMRPLGIPTVRDRVVQTALKAVLEPIFEISFHDSSYGFRPERKAQQALQRVIEHLHAGLPVVVDVDFRKFFDSIPHDKLISLINRQVKDRRIISLLKAFLEVGIMDGDNFEESIAGTPQGGVISPLLANIYLNSLDYGLAEAGFQTVRYADDFVVLCNNRESAETAMAWISKWAEEWGLQIHPDKTRMVDMREKQSYFDFLGYRFLCHQKRGKEKKQIYRFVRPASMRKVKQSIRHKSKRNNGKSLEEIICKINRSLKGWFEYFRSAHWTIHRKLDGWIRRRLRSILRRRSKRKGISRGLDHNRWPNKFFHEQGLFSLENAHASYVNPHKG